MPSVDCGGATNSAGLADQPGSLFAFFARIRSIPPAATRLWAVCLPIASILLLGLRVQASIGAEQSRTVRPSIRPGNYARALEVGGQRRSYFVHIPRSYDAKKPVPTVLALHGLFMNGRTMAGFSGLDQASDEAGFVVVYPEAAGFGLLRVWNAGAGQGDPADRRPDDVAFIRLLLDDLKRLINVDERRVFATGMSNGGMMCYRLAADLSDRIAAIAPVAGTMAIDKAKPAHAVSVIHFHGTADDIVPFGGPNRGMPKFITFRSVRESIRAWCQIDGCPSEPKIVCLPDRKQDGTSVKEERYGPGRDNAEVVLITIEGGGHTWPGRTPPYGLIGKSTLDISANELIWEFFQKHPMR